MGMGNLKKIIKNHIPEGIILMDLMHDTNSDFIKVTIDSPRNIYIGETSNIAKRIKNDQSIVSMFPNGCRLEVGTPGVGTNLVEKFQYEKNIGRKIFLEFHDDDLNIVSSDFLLTGIEEEGIIVSKSKKVFLIMFKNILIAKIKVSFD